MTTPALNLNYVHSKKMGYGRLGSYLAEELVRAGIDVYDHLDGTETWAGDDDARNPTVTHTLTTDPYRRAGRANVICWIATPLQAHRWWKGQVPIMFTMWEGMRLPETLRQALDVFDTIVVPSQQNVELYSQYHDNVAYNPLGIDPAVWHYTPRTRPGPFFRFLIGGSGVRKGTDLAVKAFKTLWGRDGSWGDGPIPTLTLKSPLIEDYYGRRIEIVSGRVPEEDEVAMYESAHCYLQPSRGEGFGLQPLQAIAQGCPTILTDAHGHAAYAHLGLGLSTKPAPAAYFSYGDAGNWWEPDFDELVDHMRDVYDNYDRHRDAAFSNASAVLTEQFTWEGCARRLVDIIGPDRLGPYTGPDELTGPPITRFKIITNRDLFQEHAGTQLYLERGKEYWQTADVKRVLFEAGILDPACLDDNDPGLTADQVERLGKYRAEHSACPTCGKKLSA